MNIYIGIDKYEQEKFMPVALAITKRIEKDNIAKTKRINQYDKTKGDICILFSNRIKYLEAFAKDAQCDIVNVTDNLSSTHIVDALKYVKDIYYLRSDANTIMDRLTARVRLLQCNER